MAEACVRQIRLTGSPRAEIAPEGEQLNDHPRLLRSQYSSRSPGNVLRIEFDNAICCSLPFATASW